MYSFNFLYDVVYFSFCVTSIQGRFPTLLCPFFFESPKKNRRRKRWMPETPIPLRTLCHSFSLCGLAAQPVIPVTGRQSFLFVRTQKSIECTETLLCLFGSTTKNEYTKGRGIFPCMLVAQKKANSIYMTCLLEKNKKTFKNFSVPIILNENENV